MRVIISFLILLALLSAQDRPVVAVLPFEEANTDWLSQGLAWSLLDKLRCVSALKIADTDLILLFASSQPSSRRLYSAH